MQVELRDALEFLFPDSAVGATPRTSMTLDVARGGTAAVHILLAGLAPGETVRLAVRQKNAAVRTARWFKLVDVPVEQNTGLIERTEKPDQPNPNVIRRAPFRVFDAMEPVGGSVTAVAPTMALRLHVAIDADQRPGRRNICVEVRTNTGSRPFALAVNVHKAVIPQIGSRSLPYTNWFSLANMAGRHNLRPWSEGHWGMIARYARLMARNRQNTFLATWGDVFTRTVKGLVLNRERLGRIVKTFTAAGMYYIEGGHVATRTGGAWKSPTFDVLFNGPRATTPEGNADLASAARQLMEEIERHGWRPRWIQHVTDEPIAESAADYRILVGMIRKYMPGLPILDATMETSLAGSVDIWCPQAQEFQAHMDLFRQQQALGDRVWFYTCLAPGGPYLNRLLDMELLRPALFGWAAALFGLQGFLHWGLNHYQKDQDPFQKSVCGNPDGGYLPAGDTHVVYPGKDGPWSSLRLEAQREGFEDYELLAQLKHHRPKMAETITRRVITGFDAYTKDVQVFRAVRRGLLEKA